MKNQRTSWRNNKKQKDSWKKIEKNNLVVALNVSYTKIDKTYPAYDQNITQSMKSKLFC